MSQSATGAFDALFHETRKFPPSSELTAHGTISDPAIYEQARQDPEAFWDARAREQIDWFHPGTKSWTGSHRSPSGSSAAP